MKKRNSLFAPINRKDLSNAESLSVCCFEEDNSDDDFMFSEGEAKLGKAIATFNFGIAPSAEIKSEANKEEAVPSIPCSEKLLTTEECTNKPVPRGQTPPVDGEFFTLKRGYQLRPSTLRKLNELKTLHPDVNVHFNTLLDAAILHYYNYITKENGKFTV